MTEIGDTWNINPVNDIRIPCPKCYGRGRYDLTPIDDEVECSMCEGVGMVQPNNEREYIHSQEE